ncbi:MAG: 4'-phosphopantetheinyl transferase superfamily protein [Clostridia bacterium]|nr:4'-phosphopantetheinyl transferase superfamily protein [Clostridia bacterium]
MKLLIARLKDFSQEEYNKYYEMLDDARVVAVDRMKNETDKRLSVLGESLARKGISEALKIDERAITFTRSENGKPSANNLEVHFSVSHSKGIAVCVISDKNVGADIEKIRFCEPRVTKFACVDDDLDFVFGVNTVPEGFDEQSLLRFFILWTAKEAYIKFCGKKMANIKDFSYNSIKSNCQTHINDGYVLTIYSPNN